jgi:hypothetical protein
VSAKSRHHGRTPRTDRLPWYRLYPERFAAEQQIVSDHPSSLTMRIDHERQRVLIEGKLRYPTPSGNEQVVAIRIILAREHPYDPPIAEDVDTRFPQTADFHKIPDTDRLCIWFRPAARWSTTKSALDDYLSDVVLHVHRQLVYEANPSAGWPGPAHAHAITDAYLEILRDILGSQHVAESLAARWRSGQPLDAYEPCPCGSGKKWRWCHRDIVRAYERKSGNRRLADVFRNVAAASSKEVA